MYFGQVKDLLLEPVSTAQQINIGEYPESNCRHVRNWARKCEQAERRVFCEMLELCKSNEDYCWYEQARWIKFEETVEGSKQRWSKPHIPLLTLKALLQLRNCLKRGVVLLDLEIKTFPQLVDKIIKAWEDEKSLDPHAKDFVRVLLLSNKDHMSSRKSLRVKLNTFVQRKLSNEFLHMTADQSQDHSACVSASEDEAENEAPESDSKLNVELSKKLTENAEVAVILVGKSEHLETTLSAFVRLKEPKSFSNLSEVNRRLRFLMVILAPDDAEEVDMVGRAFGVALTDDVFIHLAYESDDPMDFTYGIDEMLSSALIIPPGKWSTQTRLEPSDANNIISRRMSYFQRQTQRSNLRKSTAGDFHYEGLRYTGRLFGGFVDDVKRKSEFYISDFVSAVSNLNAISQCLAASLFLFFANFTNIITFGGVMGKMLKNQMAVMECMVSGFLHGIVFGFLSGQPLNILSATGPVLIFESIFYRFCKKYKWAFLPARFWLGLWTSLIIFVLVAFDASFLVAFITRFTEDCFATLISVIFIVESFQAIFQLAQKAPITPDPSVVINDSCKCIFYNESFIEQDIWTNITDPEVCKSMDGIPRGAMCYFHPDIFVFSLFLFFATFALAFMLRIFRESRFFPTKVRSIIGDFTVFLTILIMTVVSYFVGLPLDTLHIPTEFKPSIDRSWIVDIGNLDYWMAIACFLPAILLSVLIVMDQQITAVIVNRKDNKLKKGFGYHLDLFIVGVLIMICSILGIPFFVAATILSITHVQSLKMVSDCTAPGEKPIFLGVREQRVTTIVAHLLIGLLIFLPPVQRAMNGLIPISVLLGIFLYMGVTSMLTQQFVDRLLLFFTPVKYQPDYEYLRLVPLKRVFLFTILQLGAFVLLCAVKYTKPISMLFPVLLIVLVGARKALDHIFSQTELSALDDILPSMSLLRKPLQSSQTSSRLPSVSSYYNKEDKLLKT